MTTASLAAFVLASAVFSISPGPDNLFMIAQGLSYGRRAAIATGMGMCCGVTVHTLAVSVGLAAVFGSSAVAFDIVKYAGAGYLLFLAWKTFAAGTLIPEAAQSHDAKNPRGTAAMFRRGFLMNVLNPKVALFFLAFLPQFADAESEIPFPAQIIILGALFMAQAVVNFSIIGFFAGSIGEWIKKSPSASKLLGSATALVFAALGLRLILLRR